MPATWRRPSRFSPAPFMVEDGARVIPVNDLARVEEPPEQYVIVGSGKPRPMPASGCCRTGAYSETICWVRPRDPWMFNRAVAQPDPAVFLGMAADTMAAAAEAGLPDHLFLGLEAQAVTSRIDREVTPTMAKTPTIAMWEIARLRTVSNGVVRRGHVRSVAPGRVRLDDGEIQVARRALVVHCAASGAVGHPGRPDLASGCDPPPWPTRVGFPALRRRAAAFVEATRTSDEERNDACRPSPYSDTPADWVNDAAHRRGCLARDVEASRPEGLANTTSLNPARVPPERAADPLVVEAARRFREAIGPGRARLAALAR